MTDRRRGYCDNGPATLAELVIWPVRFLRPGDRVRATSGADVVRLDRTVTFGELRIRDLDEDIAGELAGSVWTQRPFPQ